METNPLNEDQIEIDLTALNLLQSEIIAKLFDSDGMDFKLLHEKVQKYKQDRAEILVTLTAGKKVPRVKSDALRIKLREFMRHKYSFEEALKETKSGRLSKYLKELLHPELSHERRHEVAEEVFLTWFSHLDYVDRMIETGGILVKNIDLPEKLEHLIYELRQCIIFHNFLAAGIMLRTIVEVCIDDIFERMYPESEVVGLGKRLDYLEGTNKFMGPAGVLNAYRKDLNKYVHGNRLPSNKFTANYAEIILDQVQDIYEKLEA